MVLYLLMFRLFPVGCGDHVPPDETLEEWALRVKHRLEDAAARCAERCGAWCVRRSSVVHTP